MMAKTIPIRFERRIFVLAPPPALLDHSASTLEDALNDALIHLFTLFPTQRSESALVQACVEFWSREWPEPPFEPNNYQEVHSYLLSGKNTLILSLRSRYR